MERKTTPKVDLTILGNKENTKPLKKPLSPDALASRSHREYMEELNKARAKQEQEEKEDKKGNSSGQTKA